MIKGALFQLMVVEITLALPNSYPESTNADKKDIRNIVYRTSAKHGKNGAVAADSDICSHIGVDILKSGGNAVDATVSAVICQGLIYPFASGIGGGGFMVVKSPKEDTAKFINFREVAPLLSNETMFINQTDKSKFGGLAVAVPGEIRGLELAHQKWGKLKWSQLFQPTIELANQGYPVTQQLADRLQRSTPDLSKFPDLVEHYTLGSKLAKAGQVLKSQQLAATLQKIATQGSSGFYEGSVAESLVKTVQLDGGILSLKDLKDYQPKIKDCLVGNFNNLTFHVPPPPSSGTIVLHILYVLEEYLKTNRKFSDEFLFNLQEAMKFGFAHRANLGDPDFVDISGTLKAILDKKNAKKEFSKIQKDKSLPIKDYAEFTVNSELRGDHGTSHVSVVDKDGLSVSITSTINLDFGSMVLDKETGVLLNDEMDDFSTPGSSNAFGLPPSKSNFIRPGKVPQSSMSPLLIYSPQSQTHPILNLGASGGSRIITSVLQTVINHLSFDQPINQAIALPRIHNQLYPSDTRHELGGFSNSTLKYLKDRNTTFKLVVNTESNVNGITYNYNSGFTAASDGRKSGAASAF